MKTELEDLRSATAAPRGNEMPEAGLMPLANVAENGVPEKAERATGINVGADTVTQNTRHLPEAQRMLIRWLHSLAREQEWSATELETRTDVSYSTHWRIWNDKYRAGDTKDRVDLEKICA